MRMRFLSLRILFRIAMHRNHFNRPIRKVMHALKGLPILIFAAFPLSCFGQTVTWGNSVGGNFAVGGNWVGGSAPNSTQTANFDFSSDNLTVAFTNPTATKGLTIGSGTYIFNLDGHTYSVFDPSSTTGASIEMGTSASDIGRLSLVNGRLQTDLGIIGSVAGSAQKLILNSGSRFDANNIVYIGSAGKGSVDVQSGGAFTASSVRLGEQFGSQGTLEIVGAGAKATMQTGSFGRDGISSIVIDDGGQLNSGGVELAHGSFSKSTISIRNGEWNVQNGNVFTGAGTALIDVNFRGRMTVTDGYINIDDKSQLRVLAGTLEQRSVNQPIAFWIRDGGQMYVGLKGTVEIGGQFGLQVDSGGSLTVEIGTLTTSNLNLAGTLNFDSGKIVVDGGNFNKAGVFAIGGTGGATSDFSLVNGATTSGITSLFVGDANSPWAREFNVLSGSTLTTLGNSVVGLQGTGGVVHVSGAGSTWNSQGIITVGGSTGKLIIENNGYVNLNGNSLLTGVSGSTSNGSLLIQSGGKLSASSVELARAVGSTSNVTVTGIGSELNGKALFIGGTGLSNGGTSNVSIADGAAVNIEGTTRIHNGGTLNLMGGSFTTESLTRDGALNFSGGTLTVVGGIFSNNSAPLTLTGASLSDNPTLVLEGSATTSGITSLNVGSSTRSGTVTLNEGSQLTTGAAAIASRGTLNLNGGTLNLNSFSNNGAFHWNSGTINYANNATLDSSTLTGLLGSSHRLADNQTLASSSGTITLGSALTVDGGTFRPANFVNNSTMTVNAGNVEVASNFTNNANRIVQLNGTSSLSAAGAINNSGSIQLTSPAATISGGAFTNLTGGTVSGSGTIYNDIGNRGTIRATGSEHLVLAGGSVQNLASINLSGGTLEVANTLVNRDGAAITGRGTFVGSSSNPGGLGLTNDGVLSFSSGNADIYGDVNQTSNGRVVTSGSGVTTFYDDVVHNGAEIRTFEGSRTVFLGAESGAGNFTGTGTVEFAGDLRPGNSPASIAFGGDVQFNSSSKLVIELGGLNPGQFDQLLIAGNLSLDGKLSVSLINGFTLDNNERFLIGDVSGSRFGLFNGLGEGALVGNFSGHDLFITYGAGNGNDIALITAVPEPSTIGLIGLALVGGVVPNLRRKWSRKGV